MRNPAATPRPGKRPCPYCETPMECDEVDVGIRLCPGWPIPLRELRRIGDLLEGPEGDPKLSEEERKTGFYKPGSTRPSPRRRRRRRGSSASMSAKGLDRLGIPLDESARRDLRLTGGAR